MKKILPLLFCLLTASPVWAYKLASGSYTGNVTEDRTIDISDTTTPSVTDFQPSLVIVKCDNASDLAVWSSSAMPADTTYRIASTAGGFAGKIKSFVSNGFTIGANNEVNRSATTCWYVALANDANNDFTVGTYTSNTGICADNCDVTISPAFQPNFVLVQGGTHKAYFKTVTHSTVACPLSDDTCAADVIQVLNANGFQYGASANSNSNGTTYYYFAIKALSGSNAAGSYTGNTTDNQQITSLGFQPEFMFIKGNSVTAGSCGRFKDNSGDDSIPFLAGASAANQVQNFLSNGFEYGTAACVNEDTVTMYWYAIKAPTFTSVFPQIIIVE